MTDELPPVCLEWLAELDRSGKSVNTITAYRRGLSHFLRWYSSIYGDDFIAEQVMARDVGDWRAQQQRVENAAPATVNQRLVALKRFFKWSLAQRIISDNPAEAVDTLRINGREVRSLSNTELRRLLRAARRHRRDFAMLEVLVGTGVRVSELLDLRVGDIAVNSRSGKLTVRYGKGGGYREVPLTADVRKALLPYLEEDHHDPLNSDAPLWLGTRGGLRHRSSVTRMIDKYALRAGLEAATPHMLRHTFATRYLAANPDDLRGLARLLGHASLDTVMIYTEPGLDDLIRRMERVESQPADRY